MNAVPKLAPEDLASPVWGKVKTILEYRLGVARAQLEKKLSFDETNTVRGRIVELRELTRLGDPSPEVETY